MGKKYQIIYADPAWTYRDKAKAGKRGASCKYTVMSTKDICNLPIKEIAEDNSVLIMWITMPKLNEVFEVIKAWGFEYKTCLFTWVKTNKKSGTLFWGMGRHTRANAELCLLATRGKGLKRLSAAVHSVIMSPFEGHSTKPQEAKKRILQLYGDKSRVELFARQSFDDGWDYHGNEIDGKNLEESLKE